MIFYLILNKLYKLLNASNYVWFNFVFIEHRPMLNKCFFIEKNEFVHDPHLPSSCSSPFSSLILISLKRDLLAHLVTLGPSRSSIYTWLHWINTPYFIQVNLHLYLEHAFQIKSIIIIWDGLSYKTYFPLSLGTL